MWRSKRHSTVPDDVSEARAQRVEATAALNAVQGRAPAVSTLTARLIERRAQNHFGDALQITFTPRGGTP